jgi:Predicted ATPase (AAA+ superfamily)
MRYAKRRLFEVFYWYSQNAEVDIIIKNDKGLLLPIQVTYELNEENRKREIDSIKKFSKYGKTRPLIITFDQEGEVEGIKIIPAYKFLLKTFEILDSMLL